jgi:hypothetical protein
MITIAGTIITILFALFLFCLLIVLPLAAVGLVSMSILGTVLGALKGR